MRVGRTRLLIALCVVLVPAFGSIPASRAATVEIDVLSNLYSPDVVFAPGGESIRWRWAHGGHSVTAIDGSFDSGVRGAGSVFDASFPGTQLRYRCTVHSWIDPGSGQCNGMCGVLRDTSQDAFPPQGRIDEPGSGSVVVGRRGINNALGAVTFRGTATDDRAISVVRLRVARLFMSFQEYTLSCTGCGTTNATWSTAIGLLPGRYEAHVVIVDTAANVGRSPTIAFTVV